MKHKLTFLLLFIGSLGLDTTAQVVITPDSYQSDEWDFQRLKTDTSELNLHYAIKEHAKSKFELLNPSARISFNSKFPFGYNDGAVWKGRGFNYEVHAGFSGSIGILSYTFQPVFFFAQNREFALASTAGSANPYNYQFNPGRIDWVQRFGDDSYSSFHLGQSEVKLSYKGFKIAAGTQNYSIGPSKYFPILMSNNAGGIPNFTIGTDGAIPLKIWIIDFGKIEGNVTFGSMKESGYFDEIESNNTSYLYSYHISYRPSIVPNLILGVNKVLYKQKRFWESQDIFSLVRNKLVEYRVVDGDTIFSVNDFFDQMASFTGEWSFPEIGFRVYGEYAINDFNGSPRILEPEHSNAYVLGFQKLFVYPKFEIAFSYEHLNLSRNHTYLYRAEPPYYTHGFNRQGYTNNGQIMGSSTGPGSNADHVELKIKLKNPKILALIYSRRTEFNKDYFITHDPGFRKHNVGIDFGSKIYYENQNMIFGLEVTHNYEFNRYFVQGNNQRNMYAGVSFLAKINE